MSARAEGRPTFDHSLYSTTRCPVGARKAWLSVAGYLWPTPGGHTFLRMSNPKNLYENEGEGSRTAAREYNEGVQHTLEKGRVAEDAEAARQEVESNPEEFRRAEEEGKRHSAGEAPGDIARGEAAEDDIA